MKTIIILILISLIIYYHCYMYESFSNTVDPFVVNFDNDVTPLIMKDGLYFKDPETINQKKIPKTLFDNVNHITYFTIHPTYYALISLNKSEPRVYRGTQYIQDYNLFKYATKIEIIKNIDKLI